MCVHRCGKLFFFTGESTPSDSEDDRSSSSSDAEEDVPVAEVQNGQMQDVPKVDQTKQKAPRVDRPRQKVPKVSRPKRDAKKAEKAKSAKNSTKPTIAPGSVLHIRRAIASLTISGLLFYYLIDIRFYFGNVILYTTSAFWN